MNNTISEAYDFYKNHIYDEKKIALLTAHNLKIAGFVPSVIWELFGSILTGKVGRGGHGADLQGWEVKSATWGSSYEYQYHLKTGMEKLIDDCYVNHLFCSYSQDYRNVIVKVMRGPDLAPKYFNQWVPQYEKNYNRDVPNEMRRQRFRKSISFGTVQSQGFTVLEIVEGNLVTRNDELLEEFNHMVNM